MGSQKELMLLINKMAKNIKREQAELSAHQVYLSKFTMDNRFLFVSLILPSFFSGWRAGKFAIGKSKIRGFLKFILFSTLRNIRKL